MRVVYRSLWREIREARNTARERGREIDHIELTKAELEELAEECGILDIGDGKCSVLGITIITKESK